MISWRDVVDGIPFIGPSISSLAWGDEGPDKGVREAAGATAAALKDLEARTESLRASGMALNGDVQQLSGEIEDALQDLFRNQVSLRGDLVVTAERLTVLEKEFNLRASALSTVESNIRDLAHKQGFDSVRLASAIAREHSETINREFLIRYDTEDSRSFFDALYVARLRGSEAWEPQRAPRKVYFLRFIHAPAIFVDWRSGGRSNAASYAGRYHPLPPTKMVCEILVTQVPSAAAYLVGDHGGDYLSEEVSGCKYLWNGNSELDPEHQWENARGHIFGSKYTCNIGLDEERQCRVDQHKLSSLIQCGEGHTGFDHAGTENVCDVGSVVGSSGFNTSRLCPHRHCADPFLDPSSFAGGRVRMDVGVGSETRELHESGGGRRNLAPMIYGPMINANVSMVMVDGVYRLLFIDQALKPFTEPLKSFINGNPGLVGWGQNISVPSGEIPSLKRYGSEGAWLSRFASEFGEMEVEEISIRRLNVSTAEPANLTTVHTERLAEVATRVSEVETWRDTLDAKIAILEKISSTPGQEKNCGFLGLNCAADSLERLLDVLLRILAVIAGVYILVKVGIALKGCVLRPGRRSPPKSGGNVASTGTTRGHAIVGGWDLLEVAEWYLDLHGGPAPTRVGPKLEAILATHGIPTGINNGNTLVKALVQADRASTESGLGGLWVQLSHNPEYLLRVAVGPVAEGERIGEIDPRAFARIISALGSVE